MSDSRESLQKDKDECKNDLSRHALDDSCKKTRCADRHLLLLTSEWFLFDYLHKCFVLVTPRVPVAFQAISQALLAYFEFETSLCRCNRTCSP